MCDGTDSEARRDLGREKEGLNMTKAEAKQHLDDIEAALIQYACYHVDWERLHFDAEYKVEFPKDLNDARSALKALQLANERTV